MIIYFVFSFFFLFWKIGQEKDIDKIERKNERKEGKVKEKAIFKNQFTEWKKSVCEHVCESWSEERGIFSSSNFLNLIINIVLTSFSVISRSLVTCCKSQMYNTTICIQMCAVDRLEVIKHTDTHSRLHLHLHHSELVDQSLLKRQT